MTAFTHMKPYRWALALCLVVSCWSVPAEAQRLSDDAIRKLMMEESLVGYRGNCPCPQNLAANGSRCGARSAYSKRGGAGGGLLCYPEDITDKMVDEYRRTHGSPR
jgi:hypothetical protein